MQYQAFSQSSQPCQETGPSNNFKKEGNKDNTDKSLGDHNIDFKIITINMLSKIGGGFHQKSRIHKERLIGNYRTKAK